VARDAEHDAVSRLADADGAEDGTGADVDPSRRWLVLSAVCLAQLMVVPDATIVNIALPRRGDRPRSGSRECGRGTDLQAPVAHQADLLRAARHRRVMRHHHQGEPVLPP
jgi:hypothetical protein